MKYFVNVSLHVVILLTLLITAAGCQQKSVLQYLEMVEPEEMVICKSDIGFTPDDWTVLNGKLVLLNSSEGLFEVDPEKGNGIRLFDIGQGPESLIGPKAISIAGTMAWICSYSQMSHLYRVDFSSVPPVMERWKLPAAMVSDDVVALPDGSVACSWVYWEDGLVRVFSGDGKESGVFGKARHIDLMMKFNVNRSYLYRVDAKLYVVQSIVPEIQVIDLKHEGRVSSIPLDPPFYQSVPDSYDVAKYDRDAHWQWMARWTRLSGITGSGPWILVQYRRGYDQGFLYEFVNLDSPERRFYWGPTDASIRQIHLKGNKLVGDGLRDAGEGMEWVEYRFSLPLE